MSEASKTRSLRLRAGIAVAVFLAIGALSAGVIAHREMAELTHQAALLRGRAVLEALAVPAAVAIATNDLVELDSFVAELERAERGEILLVLVLDQQGQMIATSHTGFMGDRRNPFGEAFTKNALSTEDVWFEFGPKPSSPTRLDIALPIRQGQRWGTLAARFSLATLRAQQANLTRVILVLSIVAGLLGWLVATFFLDRFVLRPTKELSRMATAIGENNFEVRSTLNRKDEIGALGSALNQMASRLKLYTEELELAVRERTRELEQANVKLARLATTDSLTGLRNVRFFQESLRFEIERARRHPLEFSLCMLDLDHFKNYNDSHGHPMGDALLKEFSKLLLANTRSVDVVARYGGEEFVILLLDTNAEAAMQTADKLVALVRRHTFSGEERQPLGRVTVSAGVASYPAHTDSSERLIEYADRALYEAKHSGRDRVVCFTEELLKRPSFSPQNRFQTEDIIVQGGQS